MAATTTNPKVSFCPSDARFNIVRSPVDPAPVLRRNVRKPEGIDEFSSPHLLQLFSFGPPSSRKQETSSFLT